MSRTTTQVSKAGTEPAVAMATAGLVVASAERRLAAEHWLLMAATDRTKAREEWRREGRALLRCGGLFGAVRIDAALVHAAAGTDDLAAVDEYLARALLGGPVFMDQLGQRYYALVGITTGMRPAWQRPSDDAEYMGQGHYLGVPEVAATEPTRRCYWCVEMDGPGALVAAGAVSQLVSTGRDRFLKQQRGL